MLHGSQLSHHRISFYPSSSHSEFFVLVLLKNFVAAQLRPTLVLSIRTSEYIDWVIIQLIFAHNHLAQWVNAWYRSERNCPPLNLRTSRYLLYIIQHAWLINMSLVKGMTFKMTQAAKTIEKEHFRHGCRAQGIPLYFSRIVQPRSQGLSSPHAKGSEGRETLVQAGHVSWWQIYLQGRGPNFSKYCRRCCLLRPIPTLWATMESSF